MEKSLSLAQSEGIEVRALAVINPGNPTGQCLSLESMVDVCIPILPHPVCWLHRHPLDLDRSLTITFMRITSQIVKFCHKHSIVLLADEVYQTNTYYPETRPFHSFKKVVKNTPGAADELELISFHSVSKGVIGEV